MFDDNNINPINQEVGVNNNYIAKTFLWMFFGLLATAFISYFTYTTGALEALYTGNTITILAIIELVVVVLFSFLFRKLSANTVAILYFSYAIINGITLSGIFASFEMSSIIVIFVTAALVFGVFAYLGYKTTFDLTRIGNILLGILLAGVFASLINLLVGSTLFEIVIDWIILIVFFGVTAYDVQVIKTHYTLGNFSEDKLHIYGAMQIYLDFINIFIRLLIFFAKRRD